MKRTTSKKATRSKPKRRPVDREVVMHSPLWYLAYGFVKAMAPDRSYRVIDSVYRFLLTNGLPDVLADSFIEDLRHIHKAAAGACTCTPLPHIREPLVVDLSGAEPDPCRCPRCQARRQIERAHAN